MMSRIGRRALIPVLIFISVLMLGACGSGGEDLPELPEGFTRYHNEDIDFTFGYPEAWSFNDSQRVFMVASNQGLLENPEISSANLGSLASIGIGNTEQLGSEDPVEILNKILELSGAQGQVEVVGEGPVSASINGQQAASATLRSEFEGLPLTLRLTVIRRGDRVVTVSAATPTSLEAETGPLLDGIINSVKILSDEPLSTPTAP